MVKNKFCILALFFSIFLVFSTVSDASSKTIKQKDIIILYTNDVHCGFDKNIGYSGLVAYKKWCLEKTPYVTLVDSGDSVQGDVMGVISQGEYPVKLMNKAGYNLAILGNHEFDYGMKRLDELLGMSTTKYLGCNITYNGNEKTFLSKMEPFKIFTYGGIKIAFIGISTPESLITSNPANFKNKDGKFIYDFSGGTVQRFYDKVQKNIDKCKKNGANYVVALLHLGTDESASPFTSKELLENTEGIDVALDGHSHSIISCRIIKNKAGKQTLLSSTGTKFQNIGQLTITAGGVIQTGLIDTYPFKDKEMSDFINDIKSSYNAEIDKVVGNSNVDLTINSPQGLRLIRNRETNLGDFCADAYRDSSGADIAIINGGSIRDNIKDGDVTLKDLLAVFPYGNKLYTVEATGQQILDALEMGARECSIKESDGVNPVGENGGFLQVSGLKYTIDTSIKPDIKTDEHGMLVSVGENHRVKDVQVLKDGSYIPIDPNAIYTVAAPDFIVESGGDGNSVFIKNKSKPITTDYKALLNYFSKFKDGDLSAYELPQERILVK